MRGCGTVNVSVCIHAASSIQDVPVRHISGSKKLPKEADKVDLSQPTPSFSRGCNTIVGWRQMRYLQSCFLVAANCSPTKGYLVGLCDIAGLAGQLNESNWSTGIEQLRPAVELE